jgi:alpha-L-fucosidase
MPTKQMTSTRKGNTIYVHILAWNGENLTLAPIPAKIVKSHAVTGGEAKITQTDSGVEISLPKADRQDIDTIVALEIDKPAIEIAALPGTGDEVPAHVKKTVAKKKK